MQYIYWDVFSTAQDSFWTRWFWCLLVLLLFFVSPLPHGQNGSLCELFSSGKQRKVARGKTRWIGRLGHRRSWHFWSKTAEHSARCGQVHSCITHHEMVKCVERVFKNNSLKPNAASHNNASWYTDTDGFLEHSPSRGSLYYKRPSLQKIILEFFGFPLIPYIWYIFYICMYSYNSDEHYKLNIRSHLKDLTFDEKQNHRKVTEPISI